MKNKQYIFSFRACLLAAPIILALSSPAGAKSIAKDQVNIRSKPSLSSEIIFTAPLGYPIKIEQEANNWSFFHDWQNNRGWVYKPLVSDIETAVVVVDKANIRNASNTRSQVVSTAEQGEIYKILAKKGDWVRLGYYHGGAEVGWIHSDLVFGE